ncbi:helix-turn-helix domain-containing protein [Mycobacterium montefiorense]|uniref:Transcriptional regulator n=1 Tax=Mycobacterium montefiorense TaxID=154654 RepID=A0AA37PNT4_9MYCO|nr:helix-turn-helix transcriptional regulator [Mycobacterium montefiorense]GBG37712.1 transcriptional regulator [Mycobacterium montefiorense]GKU34850.1 transcriptional regulator [Mycobacterium montefiorense]GKU40863.1 transcriptional regulator [Mycobacterium montefiorense]GKU46971.1 transcriptional regulator [Mycobacterium montefiorense]GKU49091.1 transcriptional regulator [Mycobacterium montefiorense]
MHDTQSLATFLRARRDLLKPADVGLVEGERRRVSGLRREEVAMLAGISAEYYLRLEQGRERQPSDQVLEGLASALQLNDDATQYMRNLAHPGPRRRRRGGTPAEKFDPGLQTLIDNWHQTPAYIQNRQMTILAANAMARALSPYFAPGINHMRAVFLEPGLRDWVRNWDDVTCILTSWLRYNIAEESAADPELQSLIGELSIASQRFRTLWARQEVKQKTRGPAVIDHPQVGLLELRYRTFVLPDTKQVLVTYYAESGTTAEERLQLLSTLIAPQPSP